MSKQDRQGARTATDLERKYNFGKSFAEVMGLAKDAQATAEAAKQTAEETDAKLTHDEVFNLLTKNGTLQGLYRGDDGELYINAEYIKAGLLYADLTKLASDNGSTYVFTSEEALNSFVASTARGMAVDTQKVCSINLDYDPHWSYGILTVSVGTSPYGGRIAAASIITSMFHIVCWGGCVGEDDEYWGGWVYPNDAPLTDRVVRAYSHGDWYVREWKSGQCELWKTVTATVNMTTQWGGMYVANNGIPAQTYPVEFASRPIVQCTPAAQSASAFGIVAGTSVGTYAKSPSFSTFRGTSSSNVSVGVDLYVKGTLA